jgi:NAD(P)-dependent dehydrogenase (short-subunit alcohol dehydrogenase family)
MEDFPRSHIFRHQIVFITGGTSGIGLATAAAFAAAGAKRIIVCGRTLEKWESIARPYLYQHLSHHERKKIKYRRADVRVENDVKDLVHYITEKFHRLDVAVNNAGVALGAPISEQTLSSKIKDNILRYELPISPEGCSSRLHFRCPPGTQGITSDFCENPIFTDGFGVLYCLKHEIIAMNRFNSPERPGSIVNIASVNSFWGSPGAAVYSTAKAMCLLLTRSVAVEEALHLNSDDVEKVGCRKITGGCSIKSCGKSPVRINCVAPGAVDTPLLRLQFSPDLSQEEYEKAASVGIPLGRIAKPEEITGAILFLANDKLSSYITGSCFTIDGGLMASPIVG